MPLPYMKKKRFAVNFTHIFNFLRIDRHLGVGLEMLTNINCRASLLTRQN